jgi:two-component system, chemotaxis family, protein-glutamate methylesterase/glutaminase
LLPEFLSGFPVPIVIVQHMPPIFTRLLADRLNSKTSLTVREAVAGANFVREKFGSRRVTIT